MWLQRRIQNSLRRIHPGCSTQPFCASSSFTVYDTESREASAVAARPNAAVLWYSCGPTVYDAAHVGHARAYVCQDIIRRIIENIMQQPLLYVMGMTDVDDKIIQRSGELGRPWRQHAAAYESMFLRDMQALGVHLPHHIVRVSEHIPTILEHIREIEAAGVTYSTPSGLYFDVGAFPGTYGKLRANSAQQEEPPAESSTVGASDKRSPADFALWKASKEGEPSWASPWGEGRPGWHIECSAMAAKVLGKKLHLHSGGIDLAFPHHTNEIAQTEASLLPAGCCCGPEAHPVLDSFKWVDAWMHCGHVHIQGTLRVPPPLLTPPLTALCLFFRRAENVQVAEKLRVRTRHATRAGRKCRHCVPHVVLAAPLPQQRDLGRCQRAASCYRRAVVGNVEQPHTGGRASSVGSTSALWSR